VLAVDGERLEEKVTSPVDSSTTASISLSACKLAWYLVLMRTSVREPHGLIRSSGKRPDGLTLVPQRGGCSATLDVTATDTFAANSFVLASSSRAASAAEETAQRKELKHTEISSSRHSFPMVVETLGPINAQGQRFISQLGHRITAVTDKPM
jgi:hypothetical protein